MSKTIYPPTLLCDFYKTGHKPQYPKKTEFIYSTLTPRSNRYFPQADGAVVFGIQSFAIEYLVEYFDTHFFSRPLADVVAEYVRIMKYSLGQENPDSSHIEALHALGYLPIHLKALPEGTIAPIRVPVLTLENTHPDFFWLTNYLETLLSAETWHPMTSATIAHQYRKLLDEYALKTTGSTDDVDFQAHDFSARGLVGLHAMAKSGAAHLLSFSGTDTIPGIHHLETYYGANIENELVGASIAATEHSVMSAATDPDSRDEFDMYKRLLTEIYPTGFFSVVSDTYDFWAVIGDILPRLKETILNRDGRMVIRPDSGDPVLILVGDPGATNEWAQKGLIQSLYEIIGGTVNDLGYKVLDPHIGAIYGDSITLERARQIIEDLEKKGFASTNVVLGIGSYTYQYVTRDTLGFAVKATYAIIDGEEKMLFKDPKTDDGTKRSQRGRVVVLKEEGQIIYKDGLTLEAQHAYAEQDLLQTVFLDGQLVRRQTLANVRETLQAQ